MGSRGGDSPNGLKQRELRTLFLRAPHQDWALLKQGIKTEFRAQPRGFLAQRFEAPTPVVLYAVTPLGRRAERLMVLLSHETQRLADLAEQPEALAREGFETYDHFRSYWRARTRRPYRPLASVQVFRLRQWEPGLDEKNLGMQLVRRLYGEYLQPS